MPETHQPVRVVVVGGGITGLAAAYRLQQRLNILGRPFEIQLLEASTRTGGVIASFTHEGFLLEAGPDSFIAEKRRGVALCQDLALSRELVETDVNYRRSFVARQNKLYAVPKGFYLMAPTDLLPTLLSPILSIGGKLRLL